MRCVEFEIEIKDSGKRQTFDSGMVRDTADGKVRYDLLPDGPMLQRWAEHLTKGALKYAERNWMLADGEEERARFRASAFRHFMQWWYGENDEDHAAAVFFNINGAEYLHENQRVAALQSVIAVQDSPHHPRHDEPVGETLTRFYDGR